MQIMCQGQIERRRVSSASNGRVQIRTQFPAADFTLALDVPALRVQAKGADLRRVQSRRDFCGGTFLVEGKQTFVAFDLGVGETVIETTL